MEPHYVQYISQASKTKSLTFREKIGFIESSALKELGAKLRDKRDELENHFIQNDPKKTGKLVVNSFCSLSAIQTLSFARRMVLRGDGQ